MEEGKQIIRTKELPGGASGSEGRRNSPPLAAKLSVLGLASLLCLPSPTLGGAKEFIPEYVDFSADLEIDSLFEHDRNEAVSTTSRSDTTFLEYLNLQGLGYIYSPLFVSMASSLSLGLKQERIDNNGDTYRSNGYATRYKQEFKILPTHPYNLELYFLRSTPMVGGRAGESGSLVIYEEGARARYEERPWSTSLTFTNHEARAESTTTNQSLLYNLHYFQTGLNASGLYHHNNSSMGGADNETKRDLFGLNLTREFEKIRFTSWWNHDEQEQDDQSQATDLFSLLSREELYSALDIELPANFKSHLAYRKTANDSLHRQAGVDNASYSDSRNYELRLNHRLYKSLGTSASARYNFIESSGGESEQETYSLKADYTKKIPWGSVLTNLWGSRSDLDNQGAPAHLFEQHAIDTVTFSFPLNFKLIDRDTVRVSAVDHNNNERLVEMTENIHYIVVPLNDSYRIIITNLPDELASPLENREDYTYRADYAFLPADYLLRTTSWGGGFHLPLFDNLISPHYSYSESDQKEIEGNFPGDPAHSTTHALGLGFNRQPFSGDVTRSWLRSNTTSEDRLSAFVNYRKELTPFTTGHITASFEDSSTVQHSEGVTGESGELSETIYSAQAQIHTVLPQKDMNASVTGYYSLYQGVGETTSIALYTTLVWHVGKLDLNLTASYNQSESTVDDFSTSRQHTMIKLMLKRELF